MSGMTKLPEIGDYIRLKFTYSGNEYIVKVLKKIIHLKDERAFLGFIVKVNVNNETFVLGRCGTINTFFGFRFLEYLTKDEVMVELL